MIEICLEELREDFENYLCKVEEGVALVITRDGKTVARILPEKSAPGRKDIAESTWKKPGRKPLSPWNPTAVNQGPGMVSDLVIQERKEGY